jgi:Asp-tRNA(Asn)/Glu-tRNA(Gln) amidotransferase A subunit family amidase
VSALERVESALAAAESRADLGAFWALDAERAPRAAAELDRARGRRGPLAGTPVAVKDLYDVAGLPTTAGLPGEAEPAASDAELVRRLRAAGAVPIGKTAMDPLGASTGGQAPGFPACLNPLDPALSPGGSSSGSAVAVAAGIVPLALGSDTAGSVRVPAAYCAVVGVKPARGWLPSGGAVRAMPGFDAPGLLATSVEDCVRALTALSARRPGPAPRGRLRVALLADLLEASEADVAGACERAGALLSGERGVELREARLEWRADGFGAALAYELAETWGERVDAEPSRFSELIRGTVEFGRGGGRARHDAAVASLSAARRSLARRFAGFHAVMCPTVPAPAPDRDAESVRVSTAFTRLFNALNWHAISLPAGRDGDGRPMAVQLAAPPPRLAHALALARRLEQALASA